MWKAGNSKPAGRNSSGKKKNKNIDVSEVSAPMELEASDNGATELSPANGSPPKSSQKKSLSGLTMNMRFMKRKEISENHNNIHNSKRRHSYNGAAGSTEDDASRESNWEETTENQPYSMTQSADNMFGYQNLLGRRSFGGFNPPMQAAWQACFQSGQKPQRHQATDEELLLRYKDFARWGKEGDRPSKRRRKAKSLS